jgi:hypothetical protein
MRNLIGYETIWLRMNRRMTDSTECICGGRGDVRLVHMRQSGWGRYHARAIPLCESCRRTERGKWKYAETTLAQQEGK